MFSYQVLFVDGQTMQVDAVSVSDAVMVSKTRKVGTNAIVEVRQLDAEGGRLVFPAFAK